MNRDPEFPDQRETDTSPSCLNASRTPKADALRLSEESALSPSFPRVRESGDDEQDDDCSATDHEMLNSEHGGLTPSRSPEATAAGERIDITVEARAHGWRLDHYLGRLFPNHSRAHLQRAIEAGGVRLNGLVPKASRRLRVNDRIQVQLPESDESTIVPENIPLSIVYEDDFLVVVNKPAGMIVHPGRGNSHGTLAAALQFHFDTLSDVAGRHRPGIVHRLDRDTTGIVLIAKDNQIHQKISAQFERREVRKEYRAIVRGVPELASDFIRTFMCANPRIREKMMVCPESDHAREAVTFYRTAESLGGFALMELFPKTGRTHQLRVHMQHIGTPIVADALYTGQTSLTEEEVLRINSHNNPRADAPPRTTGTSSTLISRQALHAHRLTIRHPRTGDEITFEAPLPPDFQRTLDFLRFMK